MERFCTNCGAERQPGALFCVECGHKFESDANTPDDTLNNDDNTQEDGLETIAWDDSLFASSDDMQATQTPAPYEQPTVVQRPASAPAAVGYQALTNPSADDRYDATSAGNDGGTRGSSRPSVLPYVLIASVTALLVVVAGVFMFRGKGGGAQGGEAEVVQEVAELAAGNESEGSSSTISSKVEGPSEADADTSSAGEADKTRDEDRESEDDAYDTVEITVRGSGGDTKTATIRRQGDTQRVFPDSNTRSLSDKEIASLSDAERCIAWNEIIADASGYQFKNSALASYFANCSWYHPVSGGSGGMPAGVAGENVKRLQDATSSWWKDLAAS